MTTTTIYVPQLIESAEQAEALPEGALIPVEDKDGPWEKRPDGKFQGAGRVVVDAYRVLDRIALVPIEAEEERGWDIPKGAPSGTAHRFATRWEEA